MKKRISVLILAVIVGALGFVFTNTVSKQAMAADSDFSDGITVDSTGDSSDANILDSSCNDGSGNCTLRAAIEEANDTAGTQTIRFNISETADYINGGQNGYSIQPAISSLPSIDESVVIDGYTQPNSVANSAVSPNPFNGRILIELNGSGILTNANGLEIGANNVTIKGLVINNWTFDGIAINGDNAVIQGNYIGTNPAGSGAQPNVQRGIAGWGGTGDGALIGGTSPAMRNIISGNGTDPSGSAIGIGTNHDNWTLQGNYIGLAADGVTSVPNAQIGGSGNPSIDNVSGTLVGGTVAGAANVIAGNNGHGLAPYNSPNTTIQGNYIGTDYTGTVARSNLGGGIVMTNDSHDSIIGGSVTLARNIIASSGGDGIYLSESNNVTIQGNYIGTGSSGIENFGNGQNGIAVDDNSTGVLIGGSTNGVGNRIRNSNGQAVRVSGALTEVSVIGNSIYNNGFIGIDNDAYGVTANDSGDTDTGTNDNLNFPQYTHVVENGADSQVGYRLDVPAGDYRIEFFSNTTADGTGYGEGETYLGYQNIQSAGGLQTYTHTLTGITGIQNLAMTTTQRNTGNPSSFGATSEFGSVSPSALLPTDLSLTKTLLNPEDVAIGATLTYEFEITNNGFDTVNLGLFDGATTGSDNLIIDLTPPDLTFVSATGDGVTCSAAPGLMAGFGTYLADHLDHEIVLCNYTGDDRLLAGGDSFTFTMDIVVQPESDLVFTNTAWVLPQPSSDPDGAAFATAYGSGDDFITYLGTSVNSVSYASFPLPPTLENPTTQNAGTINSMLSKTGDLLTSWPVAIGIVAATAAAILAKRHKSYKISQ